MLSWEYPPKISGGLGVACEGIAEGLVKQGHEVTVLLPRLHDGQKSKKNLHLASAAGTIVHREAWTEKVEEIEEFTDLQFGTALLPYLPSFVFLEKENTYTRKVIRDKQVEKITLESIEITGEYSGLIFSEIYKYALLAKQKATEEQYDVVHVHDWVTFKAGQLIQSTTQLPVFYHVHSIETDRNGHYGNPEVSKIEKESLVNAKYVISVSERLRQSVSESYGLSEEKVEVIPNGISHKFKSYDPNKSGRLGFVGRLTNQKGPANFLDLAQDLRGRLPNLKFDIVGDGYLMPELRKKVERLNLMKKVQFHGFLSPQKARKVMGSLDLLFIPSNSEPFGLVILEAIAMGVPVITSPNTGIAEFIPSLPQIENWDVFGQSKMVNDLLFDEEKRIGVIKKCQEEARHLTWDSAASRLDFLYRGVLDKL